MERDMENLYKEKFLITEKIISVLKSKESKKVCKEKLAVLFAQQEQNDKKIQFLKEQEQEIEQEETKIVEMTEEQEIEQEETRIVEMIEEKEETRIVEKIEEKETRIIKDTEQDFVLEQIGENLSSISESSNCETQSLYSEASQESEKLDKMVNKLINTSERKEVKKQVVSIVKKVENVPQVKLLNFIQSDTMYSVLTGKTQSGKTQSVQRIIGICRKEEVPMIISCDNKEDQKIQLLNRLKSYPENIGLNFIEASKINVMRKDLKKCFEKNKIFVLVCLNNNSQVNKIKKVFEELKNSIKIKKLMIIHDEGDLVVKNEDTENINEGQKLSHQAWLSFNDFLKTVLDPKVIFVTATPECIVVLYNIPAEFVFVIKPKDEYTGYEKIKHFDEELEEEYILDKEIRRIKRSGKPQAILYVMDRLVQNQIENCISKFAKNYPDVLVHTYNGKGITVYSRNPKLEENLKGYNYQKDSLKPFVFSIKNISISDFYDICQEIEEKVVITIGMKLINRGISFVSSYYENPLTATVMIFQPGDKLNTVSVAQTIGRILGNASPHLERRLYSSEEVYDSYVKYNRNQEEYLEKIKKEKKVLTKDIIVANKPSFFYKRPTERKELNIDDMFKGEKPNSVSRTTDSDPDQMKHLINMWWPANTIIGNILKFVYEKGTVSEKQLKDYIKECGSESVDSFYINLFHKNQKGIFIRDQKVKLSKEAKEYIEEKFN